MQKVSLDHLVVADERVSREGREIHRRRQPRQLKRLERLFPCHPHQILPDGNIIMLNASVFNSRERMTTDGSGKV